MQAQDIPHECLFKPVRFDEHLGESFWYGSCECGAVMGTFTHPEDLEHVRNYVYAWAQH